MKATEHKETGVKLQVYELGYHIVPSITEEKVAEEVSTLHSFIEQAGGTIISEDSPKLRNLSYTMSKVVDSKKGNYDEAYFGWIKFELPVLELAKFESQLKGMQNILRYLIIKTIRESTMFSISAPDISTEKIEDIDTKSDLGITQDVASDDKKLVSEDDIDKSIDALVIN